MFVPRISQGTSEVSFHISLRDFFRSSGLAAETLLKAVKEDKDNLFSGRHNIRSHGVGSPSPGAAKQSLHSSAGKDW